MNFFDKESDYGNVEYKLSINTFKKDRLLSQCLFRLREGNGKAIYLIGVTDSGNIINNDLDFIIKNSINFINIIKNICKYKIRMFTYKSYYIYSIITLYNSKFAEFNNTYIFDD